MDSDERLRWLEVRITSSLRPRPDDLRRLFGRDESRGTLLEFFFNNDARRLFVYTTSEEEASGDALKVSLSPPAAIREKCICFLKTGTASQIHSGNLNDSITCMDWSEPLSHGDMLIREVYLPLLCTDTDMVAQGGQDAPPITPDKLMDVLHRLLANIEVTRGLAEGRVCLPLPSIEVLAEAAAFQHRQPAVVHVLESTVIGWIKQIRNVLRHDALASARSLSKEAKEPIRPHHEVVMWEQHIEHMTSILEQLEAPVAMDILMNLTHANSSYAKSFGTVRAEVEGALVNARSRLRCFTTVLPWIQDMYRTSSLERMLKVFPPLLHTVLLIWKHSDYYHNVSVFSHLLQMLSNEVVARARSLVGDNPFEDTQRSYTALKDALRLCAAFRGTYLDVKDAANEINAKQLESNVASMTRLRPKDHNVLFRAKMYGPTGFQQLPGDPQVDGTEVHWEDSAWPPRNVYCFRGLSRFVERCNDLLDLVETTRHFCTLEEAAKVGGAGSRSLDALVNDIHQVFVKTIREFTKKNQDVLTIDDKQHFEKAFFHYRSVVKTLERRLAGVLRKSLTTCQTPLAHLRVLEVFEGISARELLQKELAPENDNLVNDLITEFKSVKTMFASNVKDVPKHANMPPTVSKFFWINALKQRVGIPMNKLRAVCPHVLESDNGWVLRDTFTDVMNELEKYESKLRVSWTHSVDTDVRDRLKNFVLAPEEEPMLEELSENPQTKGIEDGNDASETAGETSSPRDRSTVLKVNMDHKLLVMMRDIKYIQRPPFYVAIPPSVRALLRTVDPSTLHTQATRLHTVVSKYNHIVKSMKQYELLLFENKMRKVDELVLEGREVITWISSDLEDYLEKVNAVISEDVHRSLTRVHNNWAKVEELAQSWSEGELGIFTSHKTKSKTHSLKELLALQSEMDSQYKNKLIPAGAAIHKLLQDSFQAIEISAASPAWQLYTAQMDAVVLIALKNSILTSLDAMYAITAAATDQRLPAPPLEPILTVRLELVEQTVSFSPPMDRSAAVDNIEDAVSMWLTTYLKRASLVNRLTEPSSTYSDFISDDNDVWEVVDEIQNIVNENATECKELLSIFDNYRFLWVQDVQQSFLDFLNGRPSPNPLRASKQSQIKTMKTTSQITGGTSQRSRFSVASPDAVTEAERAFLTPHRAAGRSRTTSTMQGRHGTMDHPAGLGSSSTGAMEATIPGLAEFDEEIGIYKTARDNIQSLADFRIVGWLNINFQPIKQVLITYASKWMWTFTKYLCDQVSDSLDTLADFLARTEPEIESITGEERDTASFMKMMRLFNEVSAQQQDMEEKFAVMHRTVRLLEKYDMKLSAETQQMFKSAPDRWNRLKTKVSLAKQRLGPRIQEESARITRDLLRFGDHVEALASELMSSDVFSRECPIHSAIESIDGFSKRLRLLQTEAQDLIELQELLETAVVNFSVLPRHQRDLKNLKVTWEHKRLCEAEQRDWKLKHWQKIDTKQLQQATRRQKELVQSLPHEVMEWDVYQGVIDSIVVIEQCLPLVENLNNPAMRTRHWKQLVRVTGGLLQTDTDSLRKMVLGDLLELGLQKHAEEVKSIVQRAVKDLTIETSLKTCEEVWLGKVFEVHPHTRGLSRAQSADIEAASELTGSEMMPHAVLQTHEGSRTTGGTRTKSMKSGPHSRSSDKTGPGSVSRGRGGGRTSVLSLPISLVNLVDDPSPICLLKNVEKIFAELEHHQIELNRMQTNTAIGSFTDEVAKWQKKLQLVEAVLEVWVSVQGKWVQLDEIYSGADVRTALAHEANMFAVMSKDFRLLMRATEKNINVLQSCSRKGLLPMLEKMDVKMEQCKHALLGNLERRRQRFPRFYFLSPEDVMNIVCYGYDLNAVNKYLCKILPNLGKLIFEEQDIPVSSVTDKLKPPAGHPAPVRASKKYFLVKGLSSTAGERMFLSKALPYEGPMSQWLPLLIQGIKVTLQEQLHTALGYDPKPAQVERDLRSAGASKVRVSRPSSAASQRSGNSNKGVTVADVANALEPVKEGPSDLANQLSRSLGVSVPLSEVSWTLDNTTQVALLATSVKIATNLSEAVKTEKVLESLKTLHDKTQRTLDGAVIMLKGMEDERTSRLKSANYRSIKGKDKMFDGAGKKEGTAYSESIGAPSTKSLLDDEMDVAGDDASNEDGMEGTGPAPINTMQSLLFTEQLQSSGQGGRRDTLDMELADILPQEAADKPPATADYRLLLYPAQIHKIASLITILAQQRDVCQFLMTKTDNLEQSFDFQARLQHVYNDETMEVSLHLLNWEFEYGYEYQGSCPRFIVSPSCDRVILSMCHALHVQAGILLSRSANDGVSMSRTQTVQELAGQMGRALYSVVCSSSVDHYMLGDLFKGLAETGCWLCLEGIGNLTGGIMSVACQLAGDVLQALRTGQHTLTLQSEEVNLALTGGFFATIDYSDKHLKAPKMFCPMPNVTAHVPSDFLKNFRIISANSPDNRVVLEIRLLAHGFTQASEISSKMCILLQLAQDFFSMLPMKMGQHGGVGAGKGGSRIFSLHLMEMIVGSAGLALDKLLHSQMEKKHEYKEMVANKARKFAELWKHKSSTSGSAAIDSGGETDGGITSGSSAPNQTQEAAAIPQRTSLEEDVEAMRKMEEEAIVVAMRDLVLPRMAYSADRNLLITLIQDLWPEVEVDYGVDDAEDETEKPGKAEDAWGLDMNTEVSIPVRQTDSESAQFLLKRSTQESVEGIEAVIQLVMSEKKLCPSSAFQARVAQMSELANSMKAIIVTGRPGCGKTTAIDVYAETQKQLGLEVTSKRVFLNALRSSKQLFGYYDGETREWKDGLIQKLLRPDCFKQNMKSENLSVMSPQMLILHLDGVLHLADTDMFMQLLQSSAPTGSGAQPNPGMIILPNNERLRLPASLRVIWELESLAHLTPSSAVEFGVLTFRSTEVTWKVHVTHWLEELPDLTQEIVRDLLDHYLPKIVGYFAEGTMPAHLISTQPGKQPFRLKQTVKVSVESMSITLCRLLSCLLGSAHYNLSEDECERYIGYAAFWAFGGTLEAKSRDTFTMWWNEQWPNLFPGDYEPWHAFVDSESRDFANWANYIPQFTGLAGSGGQATDGGPGRSSQDEEQRQLQQDDAFVHTPATMQLNHIMALLGEAGHPVMIAGPAGCGKTALVRERVNTISSGEVAEVLSLSIHCNRLTEAGGLWDRISNYLEWKHGITYIPRGNKKLLCVVDDLNLSKPISFVSDGKPGLQSASEIIRQHLDTGGVRNVSTFKWQQVSNVAYVTTVNPNTSCASFPLSQRLSRHFSVLSCPYPSETMQKSIFSTMLNSHFLHHFGATQLSSGGAANLWHDRPMQHLLTNVAMVTIELQERLRQMYLPIPERAHYLFTLNDLDRVFRNMVLSLRKDCRHKELLLLWRHECDWTYGRRMVSDVDLERYHQALDTAVRKYLTGNKYLPAVLSSKQLLFSSVRELDSGLVTAGRYEGRISQSSLAIVQTDASLDVGDYYKAVGSAGEDEVHRLLLEAVKEYNKVNVGMNLSLYRDTIKMICRLSRNLQSPHKTGHTLLFGEGCPMLARLSVNLAAHLGGFQVKSLRPSLATAEGNTVDSDEARLAHFKECMVNLYNLTGVKGEKIVFFLSDDRVLTHECIAIVEELVRHGAISHMFSAEEETTIANSVRSEVTAAGLTYSKDAAWKFFQSTVMKNLRIVFTCSDSGKNFMAKSHEFPALFNHLNIIAMRPWSHEQLVEVTLYHIQSRENGNVKCLLADDAEDSEKFPEYKRKNRRPMNARWMENVAHLLANMHSAVRQKAENKFYKLPGQVSNYAFEKLVMRFVNVFCARRRAIHASQNSTAAALSNLDKEMAIAESLHKELDREKQILEEHKVGTTQLLSQIGQDMVITQQQRLAVQQQVRKIYQLKKSLPKYQHAHERSVFKAGAIVADTKKLVKDINVQSLGELRALQKPDNDVEDLMACIIMILKSPNSDLTWSKGAKRQMANIDRFIDELLNFDDSPLPQTTLDALDSTLEKETFTPESLQEKAGGNLAVGTLVRWVQAVVRYHALMITKVKPLHNKLQETSVAIVGAEHKLKQLESKMHALEARLQDLGDGFEQATADKNQQETKQLEMQEHLKKAAEFQLVIADEHRRRTTVLNACEDQLEWVTGVAAVGAGFATYMGAYPYMFRRMLLTVDWAQCFVERGIPLVFDSIDPVKGHRIEFMLDVQDGLADMTPRGDNSDRQDVENSYEKGMEKLTEEEESEESTNEQTMEQKDEESTNLMSSSEETATDSNTAVNLPPVAEETDADDEGDEKGSEKKDGTKSQTSVKQQEKEGDSTDRLSTTMAVPAYTYETLPFISTEEYQMFVGSIVKVLVGEELMQEWLMRDFSHHQLQNAVILHTSWQRPPLLLDPYLAGVDWYASVFCHDKKIVPVNLSSKTDQTQVMIMEKAILAGHTLMLMDCEQQSGNLLRPLIYHANTTQLSNDHFTDGARSIRWLGRRLVCPDSFRLCMSTAQPAHNIHPNIIAASQLISYIPSTETLQEDLLNRALSRVRPEIFRERKNLMHAIRQHRRTLTQLDEVLNKRLVTEVKPRQIENSTKFISSVVELKAQVFEELKVVENLLATLNELAEELFPIAQRAALLYTICRAMPALDPHYQIPLPFFLHLFDTTVGNDTDEDAFADEFVLGDVKVLQPYADEEEEAFKEDSEDASPDLQQRRKSKLRLGSASRLLKKAKKEATDNKSPQEDADGEATAENGGGEQDGGPKDETVKPETEEQDSEEEMAKKAQCEIVIPTVGQFPTENVQYSKFPEDDVKKIMDAVTARVFEHIYHSVHPEHQLHIAALTLLNIELDMSMHQDDEKESSATEDHAEEETSDSKDQVFFSEEELTLLIHGNPGFGGGVSLSLQDFDCQAPVPNWMSADHWEDLLAFSVLPGPLEGICVQVAQYADHWREWYECREPEVAPFPVRTGDASAERTDGISNLSDFHRLLLVRTLRPDRLLPALQEYLHKHIPNTTLEKGFLLSGGPDRETMVKDVSNTLGILIALPDKQDPEIQATLPMTPVEAIKILAESFKMTVTVVSVGDGCQQDVTRAIEQAHAEDSWLVIDGLQFATQKFYEDLQLHLARIGNISRQSGALGEAEKVDDGSAGIKSPARAPKFLVWLTTLHSPNLPPTLTQYLYKLSWKALIHVASQTKPEETVLPSSSAPVFKAALTRCLQSIPEGILAAVSEASSKTLLYSVCVCHAIALTGQCFGWHGLTQRYALSDTVLHQALGHVASDAEVVHCVRLIKNLYSDVITAKQDMDFMEKLLDEVLTQALKQPNMSKLRVHSVDLPVPSSSMSPGEYGTWITQELPDELDSASLIAIHPSALQWKMTRSSEVMLEELQDLFNAAQQPGYETSVAISNVNDLNEPKIPVSLASMQSSLEMCSEQLPNLLELGGYQSDLLIDFDFPYHRPSVLSTKSLSDQPLPESIGYVLMQECQWFNQILCHIRQQLHRLKRSLLLTSDYKLPQSLLQTAQALIAEDVPSSWLHPDDLPSTHTLLTWLADMNMRYAQFQSWIKEGMVPSGSNSSVGKLTTVWFGGLVNPNTLLTAMCHEKAVTHDTTIDKVKLRCKVIPEMESQESLAEDHEPSIYLKSVHSLNTKWDAEKCFLVPLSSKNKEINELPMIYLYPVIEEEEEASESGKEPAVHDFPVYMNISRQVLVCYLPLPVESISSTSTELVPGMQRASIVLQAGLDAARRDLCKTRTYLARKRREEWEKVSPEISELMSRCATRLSSGQMSASGHPMSLVTGGKRGSLSSHPTSQFLPVPPAHRKKRGSFASSQGLDAASKAKSSSQHSISSHASTNPPGSLSHKPPSRVLEEQDEDVASDAGGSTHDEGGEERKPLPNGRIINKERAPESDRPSSGVAADPPGTEDAVARGVIEPDFFAIKEPPSTEASLLQSILDEEQPEDGATDDEGSEPSNPSIVPASNVGTAEE